MTKIEALELELAAHKMVEGTELDWFEVIRMIDSVEGLKITLGHEYTFAAKRKDYELALGILEDKPVWKGDEIYSAQGVCFYVAYKEELDGCSWNPPKPKTVMVELPLARSDGISCGYCVDASIFRDKFFSTKEDRDAFEEACRKALEELNE